MSLNDLETLQKQFGVEWDRVIDDEENGEFFVYGWLSRPDGKRDFVLLQYTEEDTRFTTSSAKYSKKMHEALGFEGNHVGCTPYKKWLEKQEKNKS